MISRRPTWMLLVTCVLLSSGLHTTAAVASGERGAVRGAELNQEWLLSQADDASAEDSSNASEDALERPTLSSGSSGPLVIQIQVLLQEQGFYSGTVDGDFNAATVEAVKAFQTEKGLEPTGSVDSTTWGPLTGETGASEVALAEEATPAEAVSQGEAATSSSRTRLIVAALALLGLGAGGFGLWKILAVPVPQPLADAEDDGHADDSYENGDYAGNLGDSTRKPRSIAKATTGSTSAASLTVPATTPGAQPDEARGQSLSEKAAHAGGLNSGGSHGKTQSSTRQPAELVQKELSLQPPAAQKVVSADLSAGDPTRVAATQTPSRKTSDEGRKQLLQRKSKQESFTDTAVAIATQSARAAARNQTASADQAGALTPFAEPGRQSQTRSNQDVRDRTSLAKVDRGQADRAKAALDKANHHAASPPPPPPAPSEIVQATPAGALEQPELVTSPLMARVDVVDMLITDLQGADPTKRRKAIWELGQRCDSRAIQPLVNLMTNSDSRQRSLILAALSEIGTQTLKPMKQALALSLQDENAEVRKNAIRDLTRIYDLVAEISHLLNSALDDPDPEVQDTARWALKQLNRIRSNAQLEGSHDQPILQQSVSPPESLSGEDALKYRSSAEQ